MRARVGLGLALFLVIASMGWSACSGAPAEAPPATQQAGDLTGVRIDVHEAPG